MFVVLPFDWFRRKSSQNRKSQFFPTCRVRVVRFYQSSPLPYPPLLVSLTTAPKLQVPHRSGHYRTSIASDRSQCGLPDLNCKCQIAVGTTGPQQQAPDPSGRTSTSSGSRPNSAKAMSNKFGPRDRRRAVCKELASPRKLSQACVLSSPLQASTFHCLPECGRPPNFILSTRRCDSCEQKRE